MPTVSLKATNWAISMRRGSIFIGVTVLVCTNEIEGYHEQDEKF